MEAGEKGSDTFVEYEILMNYGVWPSGTSDDPLFVLGDMAPDAKAEEADKAKTAPWIITFPAVASSSVQGTLDETNVEDAATL